MLQQLLMPSISSPDFSSDGVSKTISTQQWNLNISEANLQQTWGPGLRYESQLPVFVGQETVPGASLYYAIILQPGSVDLPEISDNIIKRVDCFKVISSLPADALEEAIETLSDISQFHMMRQQVKNTQCLTSLSPAKHEIIETSLGRAYDREDFYVSEE